MKMIEKLKVSMQNIRIIFMRVCLCKLKLIKVNDFF